MTVGPLQHGLQALLLEHYKDASLNAAEAWKLTGEVFLASFLGPTIRNTASSCQLKQACFQVFRRNEHDAAMFIQRCFRGTSVRRLLKMKGATPATQSQQSNVRPPVEVPEGHADAAVDDITDSFHAIAVEPVAPPPEGHSEAAVDDPLDTTTGDISVLSPAAAIAAEAMTILGETAAQATAIEQGGAKSSDESAEVKPTEAATPEDSDNQATAPAAGEAAGPPCESSPEAVGQTPTPVSEKTVPSSPSKASQPGTPKGGFMPSLAGALGQRARVSPHSKLRAAGVPMPRSVPSSPSSVTPKQARGSGSLLPSSPASPSIRPQLELGGALEKTSGGSLALAEDIEKVTRKAEECDSSQTELPRQNPPPLLSSKAAPKRPPPIVTDSPPKPKPDVVGPPVQPVLLQTAITSPKPSTPVEAKTSPGAGAAGESPSHSAAFPSPQLASQLASQRQQAQAPPAVCAAATSMSTGTSKSSTAPVTTPRSKLAGMTPVPPKGHSNAAGVADAGRCKAVRGDNPYRRKWNPRLAAARRKEEEELKQMKETGAQPQAPPRPTLGELLDQPDVDAEAEAQAAAMEAEAAEVEAQATKLAEIAAAANLADQALARQQDSANCIPTPSFGPASGSAPESRRQRTRQVADAVSQGEDAQMPDYDSFSGARSGFSLSAPKDRGPEHKPGSRERHDPLPAPSSQPATLHPGARERSESPPSMIQNSRLGPAELLGSSSPLIQQRAFSFGDDVDGAHNHSQEENLDFSQLQQLISRGIADAEAGEDIPDLDLEPPPQARAVKGPSPPPMPHREPVRPPAQNTRPVAAAAGHGDTAPETPRRAMADIRAAAEKRAYRKVEEEQDIQPLPEDLQSAMNLAAENRQGMSAIRAIAERRNGAARAVPNGASTRGASERRRAAPKADVVQLNEDEVAEARMPFPPLPDQLQDQLTTLPPVARAAHEGEPLKSSGVYRPNHVYSGRSGGTGGLSETLGLRYGQPPPAR